MGISQMVGLMNNKVYITTSYITFDLNELVSIQVYHDFVLFTFQHGDKFRISTNNRAEGEVVHEQIKTLIRKALQRHHERPQAAGVNLTDLPDLVIE
jgi:hypothetical protein